MEGIIIALIGLAGSAIGSILGMMASAKLTSCRLEQLEQRVQAHPPAVPGPLGPGGVLRVPQLCAGRLQNIPGHARHRFAIV